MKNAIITHLKYIVGLVGQFFFRIIGFFVPVQKNRLLFYSWRGNQYSCNPKYISEYMDKNYNSKYEIIWAFRDVHEFEGKLSKNIKCVKYQSVLFFFYYMSSKVIVSNHYPYHLIPTKKKQLVIDTWHGGGAYKKASLDRKLASKRIEDANIKLWSKNISLFLSSSELFTKYFINGASNYHRNVLNSGLPRNDIFFEDAEGLAEIKKKIYKELKIDNTKKIVLYAPTWRKEDAQEEVQFNSLRLRSALNKRFRGDWVVVTRMHIITKNNINDDVINANDYPDMQELLVACDVLISDYSSSIWDYSLTKKPCLLYTYDLDRYSSDVDFYVDIFKWGFPVCKTFDELISNIEQFNVSDFEHKMEEHHKALGSYENGTACKQVADYIESFIG